MSPRTKLFLQVVRLSVKYHRDEEQTIKAEPTDFRLSPLHATMMDMWSLPGVSFVATKLNYLSSYFPAPPREAGTKRKILLVHAHPVDESYSCSLAKAIEEGALEGGHEFRKIDIYRSGFQPIMSSEDRKSYFNNLDFDSSKEAALPKDVQAAIKSLQWADSIVFCYPTWWMNTPAAMKGFFDRALVPGSTWNFPSGRQEGPKAAATGLVPGLTNVKTIYGVSTYGAGQYIVALAGDNGRRMISTAIRPLFHKDCTCGWVRDLRLLPFLLFMFLKYIFTFSRYTSLILTIL
jgi:putative NADPH-quinone reductase